MSNIKKNRLEVHKGIKGNGKENALVGCLATAYHSITGPAVLPEGQGELPGLCTGPAPLGTKGLQPLQHLGALRWTPCSSSMSLVLGTHTRAQHARAPNWGLVLELLCGVCFSSYLQFIVCPFPFVCCTL